MEAEWPKIGVFPLRVSLAFHFAFHSRFTKREPECDARFTFHPPIGVT